MAFPSQTFHSLTSSFPPENHHPLLSGPTRLSGAGDYYPMNVSLAHVETLDNNNNNNDPDYYDCDNYEEGFEALMEETNAKTHLHHSSKRSRAAEVHNLSEKRRRSRINEKMKALQNLIPNSNKTDKASMLDEAIEYLKQLQLQVQMLTMRNGLSMYPLCLPDVLEQNQLSEKKISSFHEGNGLLNIGSALPNTCSTVKHSFFNLAKQCNSLNQPSTNNSNIINSKSLYGLKSASQAHQDGPSEYNALPEKFCREDMLSQPLNVQASRTNFVRCPDLGGRTPLNLQASGLIDDKLAETRSLSRVSSRCL